MERWRGKRFIFLRLRWRSVVGEGEKSKKLLSFFFFLDLFFLIAVQKLHFRLFCPIGLKWAASTTFFLNSSVNSLLHSFLFIYLPPLFLARNSFFCGSSIDRSSERNFCASPFGLIEWSALLCQTSTALDDKSYNRVHRVSSAGRKPSLHPSETQQKVHVLSILRLGLLVRQKSSSEVP